RSARLRESPVPDVAEPHHGTNGLAETAAMVAAWCGESLLHHGDDPARALAPGTMRRAALDAALAEMDEGLTRPSAEYRRRFGLVLGLERVLAEPTPALASGLTLRPHQVDALAGMLAALISDAEREAEDEANGDEAGEVNGDDHAAAEGVEDAVED